MNPLKAKKLGAIVSMQGSDCTAEAAMRKKI